MFKKSFKISLIGIVGFSLLVASGCGLNMEKNYVKMRPLMLKGNWRAASDYVKGTKDTFYKDEKNRVLYYFDQGYTLHIAGDYKASNEYMQKAAEAIEDLWTESISSHAKALVTTDNALPYQGEDFEKVLVHVFGALNYAAMGEYESARVEARIVSDKLELYNSKYEDKKNSYKDDAFIRWFSGWLRETERDNEQALNDAKIEYHNAVDIYRGEYTSTYNTPTPVYVIQDLMRTAEASGIMDTVKDIRKAYPGITWKKQKEIDKMGEVLFIHQNGESPYKRDKFVEARAGNDMIRVAFPEFVTKPHQIMVSTIKVKETGDSIDTQMAENITAIALKNLDERIGRISAKAIARAVAKYLAAKGAQKAGEKVGGTAGALLSIGGAIFGAASNIAEEADKRSWITLPSELWVGRLYLEPGTYNLEVAFKNKQGHVVMKREYKDITIDAGGKKVVFERTLL